jgi:ketosteroid isomerase-like protein
MRRINGLWLAGNVDELESLIDPDIVMALPQSDQWIAGRSALFAGFRDFCENATLKEFKESAHRVEVAGDTATATFKFEMTYERNGRTFNASGRDLWIFTNRGESWIAVLRFMFDLRET